jgi:hypothetical protein
MLTLRSGLRYHKPKFINFPQVWLPSGQFGGPNGRDLRRYRRQHRCNKEDFHA